MASPKDVKMGSPTDPVEPDDPVEAATSEAGEVESTVQRQVQRDPGRPETVSVLPLQGGDSPPEEPPRHWIGITLKDAQGDPIPRERFRLRLADGSIVEGRLDDHGYCRVEGIEPGSAQVCFPDLDADEWRTA